MSPQYASTIYFLHMTFIIKFHFGIILRPLVFDLMYWPLRPLRPKFFELRTMIFFQPKDFYIYQHDPTKCRSRSVNTFLFPLTLMTHTFKTLLNCMKLKVLLWLRNCHIGGWIAAARCNRTMAVVKLAFRCRLSKTFYLLIHLARDHSKKQVFISILNNTASHLSLSCFTSINSVTRSSARISLCPKW